VDVKKIKETSKNNNPHPKPHLTKNRQKKNTTKQTPENNETKPNKLGAQT